MIATGTDVKPLECVFFMRDVRSRAVLRADEGPRRPHHRRRRLPGRHPGRRRRRPASCIVDAVGVTEHDFVEPPLNREKSVSLKKLLDKAANLTLTEDETATLASRLAALEAQLTPDERAELDQVAGGSLRDVVRASRRRRRPRRPGQSHRRRRRPRRRPPAAASIDAVEPLAANPDLRARILELRRTHDRVIDEVSRRHAARRPRRRRHQQARSVVESWRAYLDEHRAEITAIQLLTEARERRISFDDIQELADRIARPPYNWTPDIIWNAYVAVEAPSVRRSPTARTLTDLVSLVRFTVGADDELVPYADRVHETLRRLARSSRSRPASTFTRYGALVARPHRRGHRRLRRHQPRRPRQRPLHRARRHRRRPPRPRRPRRRPSSTNSTRSSPRDLAGGPA